MVRDSLDLFTPRGRYTATGSYYKETFDSPEEGAQKFNYEYVDPLSRSYRRLFGNIQSFEAGETAIRTNDQLDYKVGGVVVTQDGTIFLIQQVAKDFQDAPKQVLRLFGTPVSVSYVLRLSIDEDNPWELK